jgi:hypothetical protein
VLAAPGVPATARPEPIDVPAEGRVGARDRDDA